MISIGDLCCVQLAVSSSCKNYILDFIFNLSEMRVQFRTLKKSIYWAFVLNKCFQRTIIDRVFYYRLCFRFLLPILFCFCSESTFQSVQLNFILHETPYTRAKPLFLLTFEINFRSWKCRSGYQKSSSTDDERRNMKWPTMVIYKSE